MRQVALTLLLVGMVGRSLQQVDTTPAAAEDSSKAAAKRLGDKGENKKRDNKKVSKKMLKTSGEADSLEATAGLEDSQPDSGSDTGRLVHI